jgi:endonuclease YncB( thermonuclease family)
MLKSSLFAAMFLLLAFNLQAATLQGKVVYVADGDTLTVLDDQNTQHKIRLQGIDAPEKSQPLGQKSKQSLSQLVHSQIITVEFQKKDKYGRTVGKVLLNGADVCLAQIKLGMAWHYKPYQSEQPKEDRKIYSQAEQLAKLNATGLWMDNNPMPPWEFRKQSK